MIIKAKRHILFFIFLIFLSQILLRNQQIPGNVAVLFFIPVLYSVMHLIKSAIELNRKYLLRSYISILTAVLFALISIKIEYGYYNIVLSLF